MGNPLFTRVPMGRNLLNSDSDYGRNLLNSEYPPSEETPHDIMMRLLSREPAPLSERMMDALKTPAAPDPAGDNLPEPGPFSFGNDAITGVRDRYDMYHRQFDGEGRREENVPELPWNVQIGGKDTWVGAKMGLGRDNDRAVDDIGLAQLPGAGFRRDEWGNLIVRLPDDATVSEGYVGRRRPIGGQEFYVNRPGISGQDAMNWGVNQVPDAAGAAVGAGVFGASKNPVLARATGAATATGANLMLDQLARRVGSKQPMDWANIADEGMSDLLYPDVWDVREIRRNWLRKK